jgi:hypothetical protein
MGKAKRKMKTERGELVGKRGEKKARLPSRFFPPSSAVHM